MWRIAYSSTTLSRRAKKPGAGAPAFAPSNSGSMSCSLSSLSSHRLGLRSYHVDHRRLRLWTVTAPGFMVLDRNDMSQPGSEPMASITKHHHPNLDNGLKRRLRVCAAKNGRSVEREARYILRRTVGESPPPKDLGRAIHARFAALDGVELELPETRPDAAGARLPVSDRMIVIATNVVSELMRLIPSAAVMAWFSRQDSASLYLTAVTEAELGAGAAILPAGRRRNCLTAEIHAMMGQDFAGRVLPFRQRRRPWLCRHHRCSPVRGPIPEADFQIAAIARAKDAAVATRNKGDFEHCGIAVLDPWSRDGAAP